MLYDIVCLTKQTLIMKQKNSWQAFKATSEIVRTQC